MKDALHDLKYYMSQNINPGESPKNFWSDQKNREMHLVPIIKSLLEKPLTDTGLEQLGAAALVFRVHRDDSGLKKWSDLLYGIGNSFFLTLSLGVPLAEWRDLAEQGRQILLRMASGESSPVILNELNSFMDRAYERKAELKQNPNYADIINAREGMGGG